MGFIKVVLSILLIVIIGLGAFYVGTKIAIGSRDSTPVNNSRTEDGLTLTFVSSTEYYYGDLGKTIIQILDAKQKKINGTCNQTISYHDGTLFMQSALTSRDISGNYYDLFVIPQVSGVYTVNVDCLVRGNQMSNSKTFHVSNATSKILEAVVTNSTNIINNLENNYNLSNQILTVTNSTNFYLTGHINDYFHNVSTNLSLIKNNTDVIISMMNSTYNLVYNNITGSFTDVLYINQVINQTTMNNAINIELIKDFLGIKPYNITVTVYQNEQVVRNQVWLVQASVVNQYGKLVTNATCTVTTPYVVNANMKYIPTLERYEYQKIMNVTGTIPFTVNCIS